MPHTIGVLGHDGFVHPDTSVMIDVTGFGQPHDGVDEDVGLALTSSSDGQFPVRTVHGVSGLESNDLAPSEFLEMGTKLGGSVCPRVVSSIWRSRDGASVHLRAT